MKEKIAIKKEEIFQVDAERAIDKGLSKGLTPDQILKHVKGWKNEDGNRHVIDKISFIMFHDYFDTKSNYFNMDIIDFFDRWQKLVCFFFTKRSYFKSKCFN